MAPNSLSPASMVIAYHTLYGTHRMTIPTLAWSPVGAGGSIGSYQAWDLSTKDAEDMVDDLIGVLEVFVPATTVFDDVTIYTQASPTSPNIPQASATLGVAGSSAAGNVAEACSGTFNFKTLANGDFKIVLLDFPIGTSFRAIHPAAFTANMLAVEAYITATTNAFAGRDDARPYVMRKLTLDLNDKLQKVYRMSA